MNSTVNVKQFDMKFKTNINLYHFLSFIRLFQPLSIIRVTKWVLHISFHSVIFASIIYRCMMLLSKCLCVILMVKMSQWLLHSWIVDTWFVKLHPISHYIDLNLEHTCVCLVIYLPIIWSVFKYHVSITNCFITSPNILDELKDNRRPHL